MKVQVVLIEPNSEIRDLLSMTLNRFDNTELVKSFPSFDSGTQALTEHGHMYPDVKLAFVAFERDTTIGATAAEDLKKARPDLKVVLISDYTEGEDAARERKLDGFIRKFNMGRVEKIDQIYRKLGLLA